MKIALAGGVGTGKSAVAAIIQKAGYTVLSADSVNRALLEDADYITALSQRFPFAVKNGKVDKTALKSRVFTDETVRKNLNAFAHPRIMARLNRLAAEAGGTVFLEIPLLEESKTQWDKVWVVDAPPDLRLARIMQRDNVNEAFARAMMNAQIPQENLLEKADEIIVNDGDIAALSRRVLELLSAL